MTVFSSLKVGCVSCCVPIVRFVKRYPLFLIMDFLCIRVARIGS